MEHQQLGYFNNDFRTCLAHLMLHGTVAHPRGTTTRELLNYNITLKDARNRIIHFPDRKTSLKYLLGEFIWYVSGSSDVAGILPYAKFWDGIRNSGNEQGYVKDTINSNYGNRLFGHNTLPALTEQGAIINQWQRTLALLKADKDTRQAVMNIHLPSDRHAGNKDVPCTIALQWFIRENKLHLITTMRSNDAILGLTNDVFQFTMLQEALCGQLKATYPELDVGHYYHNAGSMHIYDRHFEMAERIIADERAMDLSMVPMDVFDDKTVRNLVLLSDQWTLIGQPKDYDFTDMGAFQALSPYWQNLVKFCFNEDHEAFHAVYGIPE
jgi:thymidylate synthase